MRSMSFRQKAQPQDAAPPAKTAAEALEAQLGDARAAQAELEAARAELETRVESLSGEKESLTHELAGKASCLFHPSFWLALTVVRSQIPLPAG
jgi:hypothetical protein